MEKKDLDDVFEKVYKKIEENYFTENYTSLTELGNQYKNFNRKLVDLFSRRVVKRSGRNIEYSNGIASRQFMIDVLGHIQAYISDFPPRTNFSVLDVGCGSAYGTELLASLYANTTLGYKFSVTGLDINKTYKPIIDFFHKNMIFLEMPLHHLDMKYSIVVCNQVIEHLNDPVGFVSDLIQKCSGRVFITTPYEEPRDRLTRGHKSSFSLDFVEKTKPLHWEVYTSPAWGSSLTPPYKTLLAIYGPVASSAN